MVSNFKLGTSHFWNTWSHIRIHSSTDLQHEIYCLIIKLKSDFKLIIGKSIISFSYQFFGILIALA